MTKYVTHDVTIPSRVYKRHSGLFRVHITPIHPLTNPKVMTSIIAAGAKQAHSLAAGLLAKAQIAPGQTLPADIKVKEDDPGSSKTLTFTGRNLIVRLYAATLMLSVDI